MSINNVQSNLQNNTLNIGLQGFQNAQSRITVAAQEIASQSVKAPSITPNSSSNSTSINQNDLTTSLVDLKVAELDAKANVKVIQNASDLIGSLLDIRA